MGFCQREGKNTSRHWSGEGFTVLNFISLLSPFYRLCLRFTFHVFPSLSLFFYFKQEKCKVISTQVFIANKEEREGNFKAGLIRRWGQWFFGLLFAGFSVIFGCGVFLEGNTAPARPNLSRAWLEEELKILKLSRRLVMGKKGPTATFKFMRGSIRKLLPNLSSLPERFHDQFVPKGIFKALVKRWAHWTSLRQASYLRRQSLKESETNISFLTHRKWKYVPTYNRAPPRSRNDLEERERRKMKNHLDSF